ncbi:hypothetical protein [Aquibium oceanicum]|uniref:Uncharacterized protein n=1 Tax=Aquibium oceanicum TaxID=1670800 RepID=A0A1L3SLS3_9HYPH|nr:hypothetical protein [Aquibium oceanicum]APH70353.1 hypothetical protein BSQ44_02370 [Aquibium oceanicum]
MMRRVFRLVPNAEADDPNWDRAPSHGIVVVRADSVADARIVASQAEADFPDDEAKPEHGVTTGFASAFRDEKLYNVFEDDSGRFAAAGERCVLDGRISPKFIKPIDSR